MMLSDQNYKHKAISLKCLQNILAYVHVIKIFVIVPQQWKLNNVKIYTAKILQIYSTPSLELSYVQTRNKQEQTTNK